MSPCKVDVIFLVLYVQTTTPPPEMRLILMLKVHHIFAAINVTKTLYTVKVLYKFSERYTRITTVLLTVDTLSLGNDYNEKKRW